MNAIPKVSVVILNWNGQKYLEAFLPSVIASSYSNLEIIIGDNASTDNSIEFVSKNYPNLKIIRNERNYGFAGGYNKVLQEVDTDYLVLLNSDVEVQPDWIEPVIALMEKDPMIAAAQPKIKSFHAKDHFEYAGAAGGYIDIFGYPFCRGRLFESVEADTGQYEDNKEVFWASGAALFIRRKQWVEIGGFDEDFFAHMEEIDLCWRLKNLGYKINYCSQSTVYHVGGGTLNSDSPFKTYLNFRNNLFLIQKNLPFYHSGLLIFVRFWLDLLSLVKFFADGKPKHALAISKAHWSFFAGFFNTAAKSRKIDKSNFNSAGLYKKSIVWEYFIRGHQKFTVL